LWIICLTLIEGIFWIKKLGNKKKYTGKEWWFIVSNLDDIQDQIDLERMCRETGISVYGITSALRLSLERLKSISSLEDFKEFVFAYNSCVCGRDKEVILKIWRGFILKLCEDVDDLKVFPNILAASSDEDPIIEELVLGKWNAAVCKKLALTVTSAGVVEIYNNAPLDGRANAMIMEALARFYKKTDVSGKE